MPFDYDDRTTPAGHPCLFMRVSEDVSEQDADSFCALVAEGGRYHGQRILTRIEANTKPATSARKRLAGLTDQYLAQAVIATNPIVRAGVNLMLRLLGDPTKLRLFRDEAEALAWLDSQGPGRGRVTQPDHEA